jgi:4-amino-4-deoxy-L-arabinose transferase-like glycosyltransferase
VLACLVLATTVLFFVGYGAVMTDPPLGLCTAWMMVAFQRAVIDGSRHPVWRYGLFVAAGLAMLAKGPVAFLYVALPVAIWTFWRGRWRRLWEGLPWAGGTVLFAAISLPWYLWAERRTPGFLNYFLVGEHLMRFLQPGWTGICTARRTASRSGRSGPTWPARWDCGRSPRSFCCARRAAGWHARAPSPGTTAGCSRPWRHWRRWGSSRSRAT